MHVAPLVVIPHRVGPAGWEQHLQQVVDVLEDNPHLPLSIRLPGAAIEPYSRDHPLLWGRLVDTAAWLAGGWSDPWLASLPPETRRRQLRREETAMAAAGVEASAMWVSDSWEADLVSLATSAHLDLIVLAPEIVQPPSPLPSPVDRAGQTVVVFPTTTSDFESEETTDDGLAVVVTSASGLGAIAHRYSGRLCTLVDYLDHHRIGPRIDLPTAPIALDATSEFAYRKLLRLDRDLTDRVSSLDATLGLQSRESILEPDAETHAALVRARVDLDHVSHRGDAWVQMSTVDWNADGHDEIVIETAHSSLVVGPDAGTIDLWDDKASTWPVTTVDPPMPATLFRQVGTQGYEQGPRRLEVEGRIEGRSEAGLTLMATDGATCQLLMNGGSLTISYTVPGPLASRLGPELPVAFDPASTKLRVDGGAWIDLVEPAATSGHRFRLTDEKRHLVISSARPAELFVRPAGEFGLVIWPHWASPDRGQYAVEFVPT